MNSLFLFNPENDLALANGTPYFTPPKMARKIRNDLQMLPFWLAGDDDFVYAQKSKENQSYIDYIKQLIPSKYRINLKYENLDGLKLVPWGWSEALKYEFTTKIDKVTDLDLSSLRELSSRKLVIDIYDYFKIYSNLILPNSPKICSSFDDAEEFVRTNKNCMLKAPWSGSGKGVFNVSVDNIQNYIPWIKGTLKKQNAILCEVYLDKIQDFAMEFYSNGKCVDFVGYSVFDNNNRFSYEQAIVANEKGLRLFLENLVSGDRLDHVKTVLIECLNTLIPQNYMGYFGVDMLIYKDAENNVRIMPCIELNLRMTMGLISCKLGNDLLNDGKMGVMKVLFHPNVEAREDYMKTLSQPQFINGKLENGSLLLTPVYKDSVYTAVLTVS